MLFHGHLVYACGSFAGPSGDCLPLLIHPLIWGGNTQVAPCCCCVASVVSASVRPHRQQPTRLPRPWDSPGKNTGVGHFSPNNVAVNILVYVPKWNRGMHIQELSEGVTAPCTHLIWLYCQAGASLVAQVVKKLPAMQEIRVQSLGQEDPLEKGTATHSSTLARRILWTEEPGGLKFMGLKRVGHNRMTNTFTFSAKWP